MDKYKFYIDPISGETSQPTEKQLEEEQAQILVIAGGEALGSPDIWLGKYNGEMLFNPAKFENFIGDEVLNISVGDSVITRIKTIGPSEHVITYSINGVISEIKIERIGLGIKSFSKQG